MRLASTTRTHGILKGTDTIVRRVATSGRSVAAPVAMAVLASG